MLALEIMGFDGAGLSAGTSPATPRLRCVLPDFIWHLALRLPHPTPSKPRKWPSLFSLCFRLCDESVRDWEMRSPARFWQLFPSACLGIV